MIVFKPVLLKQFGQFHFLKPLDIFMRLLKNANEVRLRKGNIAGRGRGC